MKRPIRARLPILITANVLGALLALVAILGAISVLAGPAAAPQLVTIPDCGDCNVIVVAKDGGNFTDPIAAMAHIDGQTPDASNRYLLYIGPGTYLLSEPLQMLEYVDIQGAGEGVTILTRGGSGTHPQTDSSSATVSGANSAELRYLTVENIGGLAFAIGIHSNGTSPKLSHVTASVFGATSVNYGLYNVNASPVMTFVTALASGGAGTNSYGLSNNSSSSPRMTNVTVSASGSTNNLGVSNSSSSPTMTNVTATASGGTNNFGVSNSTSSSPRMTNVSATATGRHEQLRRKQRQQFSPNDDCHRHSQRRHKQLRRAQHRRLSRNDERRRYRRRRHEQHWRAQRRFVCHDSRRQNRRLRRHKLQLRHPQPRQHSYRDRERVSYHWGHSQHPQCFRFHHQGQRLGVGRVAKPPPTVAY